MILGLGVAGIRLWRSTRNVPQAGQKVLVARLGYCGPEDIRPCIVSFTQAEEGIMLVDILLPSARFPAFYLKITRETEAFRYECEKAKNFSTNISCTGPEIFPGELLQFSMIAREDERVLAEGQFAILGLLLSTAFEGDFAPVLPTEEATELSPAILLDVPTPIPTSTQSAYPNPSYPKP